MHRHTIPDPLTWFPFELPFTIKLLSTYIVQIESQVENGIAQFKNGEGTETVEINDGSGDTVAVHKGIHSGLWDLRSVFESHLPNLQRRSALITLFSFLETELDRLCERVRKHEGSAIQVSDLADKGIVRATTYLTKVGALAGIRNSPTWTEIRNIQAIRNLIVHSEGNLPDPSDVRRAKIAAYIQSTSQISGTESVIIEIGYLAHCLDTFNTFFKEIHGHMQRKYSAA